MPREVRVVTGAMAHGSKDSLIEAVQEHLPIRLSSFGETTVRAYATLPGREHWMPPPGFQPYDALLVIERGWPLAVLANNASAARIVRRAIDARFEADDLSVIHAGALLTKLGGSVEFIEETTTRTADLRVLFGTDRVEAEVTSAAVKERQAELQGFMKAIVDLTFPFTKPWHPVIHLADLPDAAVQLQIVEALIKLEAGERAGTPNVWEVQAVPFDEGSALVDSARLEKLRPDWWKDDGPTLGASGLTMPSGGRILISARLPFLTYLNQIRRKAERPQGNPNSPFLVIVDQSATPMRHQKIHDELQSWLPLWPGVSGVLCLDRRAYTFGKLCWKISFHPNPHAKVPLPASLLQAAPRDAEICEMPFAAKLGSD